MGNELREREGHDALAKRALAKMKQLGGGGGNGGGGANNNFVVTSIRHPSEVEALEKGTSTSGGGDHHFLLLFIDAPIQTRYQR